MTDHDALTLDLPDDVVQLLEGAMHWSAERWNEAIRAAREPLHRERRGISRPLCEALLTHEQRALSDWLVRDAVETAVESAIEGAHTRQAAAAELLEDAALAVLARPALPLVDLAVLLRPCLPLRTTMR